MPVFRKVRGDKKLVGPAGPGPAGDFKVFYSMFDKSTLRVQLPIISIVQVNGK